jgi:toxin secretion/phage lysis holin
MLDKEAENLFMNMINIASLFGGCDTLFKTFLIFIIIDYISGILQAIYNRQLNSQIGAKGIVKKVGYILIVVIASSIDTLNGNTMDIRNIIIYMFIANEGISILENCTQMGINIPSILKDKINELGDDNDEQNK